MKNWIKIMDEYNKQLLHKWLEVQGCSFKEEPLIEFVKGQ